MWCKYKTPDGKRVLSLTCRTAIPDPDLLQASVLLKKGVEADLAELDACVLLGELSPAAAAARKQEISAEAEDDIDVNDIVFSIERRPLNRLEGAARDIAGTLKAMVGAGRPATEIWSFFKVVTPASEVKWELVTDTSLVGPQDPHEAGAEPVSAEKLDIFMKDLEQATFVQATYEPKLMPKDDSSQ